MRSVNRYRNNVNFVLSWSVAVGLLALVVGLDALQSRAAAPVAAADDFPEVLPYILGLAGISVIFAVVGGRPRVDIDKGMLRIRNVLRDVTMPRSAVTGIDDDSGTFVRIKAYGREWRAWGCERFNIDVVRGVPSRSGASLQAELGAPLATEKGGVPVVGHREPPPSELREQWRRPTWQEVVLVAAWTGYLCMSAVAFAGREAG